VTTPGRRRGMVPGPRGSLLLGLARQLRRDQLGTLQGAMTGYGDVVHLAAGPPGRRARFYLVTHPDGVQQVLAGGAEGYSKDTLFYREIAASFGDGLLTSNGQRWRQQRRTLAPLFTPAASPATWP
jgi:cytochrome P450